MKDLTIDDIHIWGVTSDFTTVTVDGATLDETNWDFDTTTRVSFCEILVSTYGPDHVVLDH